jgi:hypothetical protein
MAAKQTKAQAKKVVEGEETVSPLVIGDNPDAKPSRVEADPDEFRQGLETGSRADTVLPDSKAPSRNTQTVTPIAKGPND